MKLSLGFSPCPNDTFIFDALVNGKIDTEEFEFHTVVEDVETLNKWALEGKLDITKLSFPAFFQSMDKYVLLDSGSALGKGVGPVLISPKPLQAASPIENLRSQIDNSMIAIPGINTTANFLLTFAFPGAKQKLSLRYDQIEEWVLNTAYTGADSSQESRLGVIIHESRFTYQQKGLYKVVDLGEYWENETNLPIPLGAIAIKKTFHQSTSERINALIKKSLEYAFAHYPRLSDYIKQHAQEMDERVMRQHIELYVNDYSLNLGRDGKQAIESLYDFFLHQTPGLSHRPSSTDIFVS